jgi:hypothetical protein
VDEKIWQLAVATLASGVFVAFLDAILGSSFEPPQGFFPFLGLVLGFLGSAMAFTARKNGNGNGKNGNGTNDRK